MQITIDKAGRIVLPKKLRESFNLFPGASLEVDGDGEEIRLRTGSREPSLIEKNGFLVHHGTERVALDVAEFINRERESQAQRLGATDTGDR